MEDEEEVRGMLPPVAASLESRSKRKMVPPSIGNRGGRGRGRGSAAAKSTTPSASISVETDTQHIEPLAEDEDGGENFDMNDATAISVSVPSDDDESQEEEDGDDVSVPSNPSKAARGRKKLKAGAGGATSQLNRHLARCTQFQNKLAKAKRQLAQDPPHTGLVIANAVFECLVEWKIEDQGEDGDDGDIESVELPSSVVESN
ncbi:hypothetical protein E2562_033375 [Oryza meyeriana var. granulata]|uniref:Uncharacterized protein n=1 Tax=Oryza meyeriana var. granulata TaxID=110450 RepID=A0A6G1C1W3_9ORYZ|nr:hypothetical protein E2562_033375 [Oryza meyeriana var. granulata]